MKQHNMFGVLVTTASLAAFALAARPACGQTAEEIANLDTYSEHLKVERDSIVTREQGKRWTNPLPATVGNAVKRLRELYPDATFAVDPQVVAEPLTDLIVRSTDPAVDLSALRTACGGKFDVIHNGTNSLYALEPNNNTFREDSSKREDRRVECFNLGGYLAHDIALDHIEEKQAHPGGFISHTGTALDKLQMIILGTLADLDPSQKQPHIQFYAEAQLLVVIGSQQAIDVAAKVIHALPGQPALAGDGSGAPPAAESNPSQKP
jgi:hypothetical protein